MRPDLPQQCVLRGVPRELAFAPTVSRLPEAVLDTLRTLVLRRYRLFGEEQSSMGPRGAARAVRPGLLL